MMIKKLIAIVLTLAICFSLLPTAFAADIGRTTEGLRKGKIIFHVGDEVVIYQQLLVELLDEALREFRSPDHYYEGVWNEAKQLYQDEVARIYSLDDLDDLLVEGFFGYAANDITVEVYEKITTLSFLDKTMVRGAGDLKVLKKELTTKLKSEFKTLNDREQYNDFYWDQLMLLEEEALQEVKDADCFAAYGLAKSKWQYYFEDMIIDPDFAEYWEYIDAKVLTKYEMDDFVRLLMNGIWDELDRLVKEGNSKKKVYSDKVYEAIDKLEAKLLAVNFAGEAYHIFDKEAEKIYELTGVEVNTEKTPATVSFLKRELKKVDALRDQYFKSDYSEDKWYELTDLLEEAQYHIEGLEFKEDISDKYFASLKKDLDKIPTLEKELTAARKDALKTLNKYLGSKKYQQSKVKKLVKAGTKKINAAKSVYDIYDLTQTYVNALEKTVKTFKITTAKIGKGTVSKSKAVKYGSQFTVKIVPAAGYKITSVKVDGKKVKLTNAYTFKKVKKAHSLKVTFGK